MTRPRTKDTSFVHGVLFTAYPTYPQLFSKILQTILSYGGIYVPEYVEFATSAKHQVVPFRANMVDQLYETWRNAPEPNVWDLKRRNPTEVEITLTKGSGNPFEAPAIAVEHNHFKSSHEGNKLLSLMTELYSILQPAYGFVMTTGMIRHHYDHDGRKWTPGVNLLRGLPDLYWANFLGPEYVELFGEIRLQSAFLSSN